jgi:hypothetical protein
MAASVPDFKDVYVRWPGHPKYNSRKIIEDDLVEVIVQKLEMILFTNANEVYGDSSFGASLEYYLWETNLSNTNLKSIIIEQVNNYVPEIMTLGYTFDLKLYEGTLRDIMVLDFVIKGYNVAFVLQ